MTAARLDDLPEWARELMDGARVAHLALLDAHDRPRVLPVTFARVESSVWTAVDHKPKSGAGRDLARVRWLRRRPEAALVVDRYDDDWSRLAWVQVVGRAAVEERAPVQVLDALARKYPQYRDRAPDGPFLRLDPERLRRWRAADQV